MHQRLWEGKTREMGTREEKCPRVLATNTKRQRSFGTLHRSQLTSFECRTSISSACDVSGTKPRDQHEADKKLASERLRIALEKGSVGSGTKGKARLRGLREWVNGSLKTTTSENGESRYLTTYGG